MKQLSAGWKVGLVSLGLVVGGAGLVRVRDRKSVFRANTGRGERQGVEVEVSEKNEGEKLGKVEGSKGGFNLEAFWSRDEKGGASENGQVEGSKGGDSDNSESLGEIDLSAKVESGGVRLSWSVNGQVDGFKVVGSLKENPTYPEDKYYYVRGDKRSFFWGVDDGREWHFRVCSFVKGECRKYSNEVVVKTMKPAEKSTENANGYADDMVKSIKVSLEKVDSERVRVKWVVEGKAERGFKVIWSKNPNPEYPTREGDYFHFVKGGEAREEVIKTGSGHLYHVRVCNYLGEGKCGTYSEDVAIQM